LRVQAGGRELMQVQRRDAAVNTVWTTEHLLKNEEDVRAFLELPDEALDHVAECAPIVAADGEVGERGIVMIDTADPLCQAAAMMSMEDYTVLAMTDQRLFHALLEKVARPLYGVVQTVARQCPGHLWRIYGPEYASEPYLPPALFEEYVVRYATPIVEMIHRHGGYARIHCHGRLRRILPLIARMGADALDPIEPPPQGDVELRDVRREYGKRMVLFGNLEAAEVENLDTSAFARRVDQAISEGMAGDGRGFVLMPSACPYGRTITPRTLANYRCMVEKVLR
jgi:uroporphyrinogen-III decarboxylase